MVEVKNLPPPLRKEGLKEKLVKICEENDVIFLAIFGSFVRRKQKRESDIDIIIEYREGSRKSLLDLVGLEEKLSLLFGRKVDLQTIAGISPYLKDEILNSMKVIYERK